MSALALAGGGAFIDTVSSSPAVREAARAFLPFAALTPICGAMAFEFDGVFIGATWTRDMRDLMLAALSGTTALRQRKRKEDATGGTLRGEVQGVDYRLGATRADKLGRNNRRELPRYGPKAILKQFGIV